MYEHRAADDVPKALLRDALFVLAKRKGVIILFFVSVILAVALVTGLQKAKYTARGSLWIDRESNLLPNPDVPQVDARDSVYYQSQFALLGSRSIAGETIDKKKLYEDPHFAGKGGVPQTPDGKVDPAVRERLINKLIDGVTVKPLRDTKIVYVEFTDTDPKFAAETLNGLIEAFVDLNIRRKYSVSEKATEFLSTQIDAVRSEIDALERKLQQYGADKDIVSLTSSETTVLSTLGNVNQALSAATIARIEKYARYNEIRNAPLGDVPAAANNQTLQSMNAEYLRLSRAYAKRLEVLKPDYPEMVQLKKELDAAQEGLESETRKLVAAAYSDYQAALTNEQALQRLLEKQKAEALSLNSNSIYYNSLKIEIQNKNALLEELLKRQGETEFSSRLKDSANSNVWVIDQASVPTSPSSPNKKLNMLLALVFGLSGGIGLAFLLEHFDDVVKSSRDISRWTGLSTLGFVVRGDYDGSPKDRGGRHRHRRGNRSKSRDERVTAASAFEGIGEGNGTVAFLGQDRHGDASAIFELISFGRPQSVQAENYRSLRTSILVSAPPGKVKSFLITSPLAQEGKSSTVSNLGIVLAQARRRVVVIDVDLRKPRLGQIFGVNEETGLTSYLKEPMDIRELIRSTEVPGLSIITSGPTLTDPVELLSLEKMDSAVAFLRSNYDYVLFDAPPLLVVSDAIALGPLVDTVILVVREGKTPLTALKEAKGKLDSHRLKCAGVILNGAEPYGHEAYYTRQYYRYHDQQPSPSD